MGILGNADAFNTKLCASPQLADIHRHGTRTKHCS